MLGRQHEFQIHSRQEFDEVNEIEALLVFDQIGNQIADKRKVDRNDFRSELGSFEAQKVLEDWVGLDESLRIIFEQIAHFILTVGLKESNEAEEFSD